MKKVFVTQLISLLALLVSMPVYAERAYYDFEYGCLCYRIYGDNVSVVTDGVGYSSYHGDVVIPSQVTYNGRTYSVTAIGGVAFEECFKLTSVSIPNSITTIGASAFAPCKNLKSVTIGSSVTSIGDLAFRSCSSLKTIVSKIEKPFEINNTVFLETTPSDIELIVPKGTKALYQSTAGWNAFGKITEEDDVTVFESKGIYYKITESNTVSVTKGEIVYQGSIIIPDRVTYNGKTYNVTDIDIEAFANCSNLTSVTISNNVISIGRSAFYGCSRLTSVTIPNSVTSIGSSAFYGCRNLTSVVLPNSLSTIDSFTFHRCSSLISITLPNSLRYIGDYAFGCSSLTAIFSDIKEPFEISKSAFNYFHDWWEYDLTELVVPKGTLISYQMKEGWNLFANITESNDFVMFEVGGVYYKVSENNAVSVLKVETGFQGDLVIPDIVSYNNNTYRVTKISNGAFRNSIGITSITIPNSVISIGDRGFYGCTGLTSVTIPNSVISIGDGAFTGCSRLSSVTIPINMISIENSVFSNCSALTSITIPNSVTSIGSYAFSGTAWYNNQPDGLIYAGKVAYKYKGKMPDNTSITIKDGTLGIAGSAFRDCSGLTSVTIPNSVTSIGDYAFKGCSGLTSVAIPNSVTSIGGSAFDGTAWYNNQPDGLVYAGKVAYKYKGDMPENSSITIKDGTLGIAGSAFYNCSGLISVTIPNSVESFGSAAFADSKGLTTITSEIKKPFDIGSWTFSDDTYTDAELIVPRGTKAVYQATEGWNKFQNIVEASDIGQVFESGGIKYKIGENNTVSVTSSETKYSGDVVIPSQVTYNGNLYTVTSIGNDAFQRCPNLTSVTIPNSVTIIGEDVFYDCKALTSVNIPNRVTSIGRDAFMNCTSLTSITIPNSVTSIGGGAFNYTGLTSIVSEISNPFVINGVFDSDTYAAATLTVPAGTKSLYQNTSEWNKFRIIVEVNSDEANFTKDGIDYQGTKSSKTVVVKAVDTKQMSVEIPASVSHDGVSYQVTGIVDDAFNGCDLGALIWNVDAALPNNAFSNSSIGSNFLLYVKAAAYAPSSIKNVVADGTASSVVLSDDGGPFYCPQAFTARSISYTHYYSMETGGSGKGWETLALPFDVQKISHSTRGEIVPFPAYNRSTTQKPFWLGNFSGSGFRRTAAVLANEPNIIAMPNSSNYRNEYNLAGDVTFSADNVQVPKTPSFTGTFVPAFAPVAQSSRVMVLNVNNRYVKYSGNYDAGSRFIANLRDVRPFEAYMTGNSSTRGIIEINFDDGATDMFDILLPTDEGQEVTIYTLSGQQITRTTQREFDQIWNGLQKGVYIVNGKKKIK